MYQYEVPLAEVSQNVISRGAPKEEISLLSSLHWRSNDPSVIHDFCVCVRLHRP